MKLRATSSNRTKPLPYENELNSEIYEYNPFMDTDADLCRSPLKRHKAFNFQIPRIRKSSRKTSLAKRLNSLGNVSVASSLRNNSGGFSSNVNDSSYSSPPSSICTDVSDLESLPDLSSGDESTPTSSPIHPLSHKYATIPDFGVSSKPNLLHLLNQEEHAAPSVFEIPELVNKIVKYADIENTVLPQEDATVRRRPLSYQHALLIHGNKQDAEKAMQEDNHMDSGNCESFGTLYNLLSVNKLFYQVTSSIIYEKIFFTDEMKFYKFLQTLNKKFTAEGANYQKPQPIVFILHKLFGIKQSALDLLKKLVDFSKLEWLEVYMCPKLYLSKEFFLSKNITRIVITGSKKIDDEILINIAQNCYRSLQILDIRACELISDVGIYQIGLKCRNLVNINFGRKNKGWFVTDTSLGILIKNNHNLNTVGLAGCYISDRSIWDLAVYCRNLMRLSINNCQYVTNHSIPIILDNATYWTNLSVLELRFLKQLTEMKSMINFKRRQESRGVSVLIELCEDLMMKMRSQELEMDKMISESIFNDISYWVNHADEDTSNDQYLSSQRI